MDSERQLIEYKSLQKIRTGDKGFKDLSVTCVALANAQGGRIYIGYDDKKKKPAPEQKIETSEINDSVTKLRSLCFNVALSSSEILIDETGSQYFIITVYPSIKTIATTSDGKIYIRIADKCEPVRSEDIQRLSEEKGSYQWEIVKTKYNIFDIPADNIIKFANAIRQSDRVKDHVKQMDDIEIAEHYFLLDNRCLTHLGILWLGDYNLRRRLVYPITVQYIVYDDLENKVRKEEWHDNKLDPKELILNIEQKAIELTYAYEFPDGLFRKKIPHYNSKVVRELLLNAIAHKSYTISSDIMIQVYTNRLEISNPGGLPLGITKDNILHSKHRRNPNMVEVLSALKLMEGEGSGYDLVYELNAMECKNQPIIESTFNEVKVIQNAEIIDKDILPLLDYVLNNYQLTQKNYIAFGVIAKEKKILSTRLSTLLQLTEEDRLRSYTDKLLKDGLIVNSGVKKGNWFKVNPKLIENSKANIKTTLKTIEPYALKGLIIEDLKIHPDSSMKEIASRLPGTDLLEIRKIVYGLVDSEIDTEGSKTNRRYKLK